MRKKRDLSAEKYSGKNAYLRLLGYLFSFPFSAALTIVLVVGSNFLALIGPRLSGQAIDTIRLADGGVSVDWDRLLYYCSLMGIFYLGSALLSYILSRVIIHFSEKITRKLRKSLFDRILDLPVGFFDQLQAGDLISRISYDIDTVNTSLANDLVQILTSLITVIGAFSMMLSISWEMLLIFLATLPLSIGYTVWKTKKVRPLFRRRSAALGEMSSYTEEMLSGLKTIKAYGREEQFMARYQGHNRETMEAYYQADYQSASIGPSVNFINNLSISIISVSGACFYVLGRQSLGTITSFIQYGRKFSGPINEFSNIIADIQRLRSAAERVFSLMDEFPETPDEKDAIALSNVRGEVEFRHVKFRYTPEREIIHDLSVKIPAGTTCAIVGPTGAGKTTLVNLLMRFYDPQHGEILLDGTPIRKIRRRDLRGAFTMVLQETWLWGGTVAENIAYGAENPTREEIENAAKAAGIHRFILSLPQGYDTPITDGGLAISKGQKQLLTIARSMLSKARMLILDEATSNVDTRTEIKIEKAMLKLMENKTSFVIAHRLSTIQNADLILVVKDGDVVETGNHAELMKKGGFYAELYRSQYQ